MKRREIRVSAHSTASPEAIYRLLADGTTWPRWTSIESFALEQPGNPPPEGVGAIRVFRRGRTTGRDQILELVEHRRLSYASLSGLPVRDYVGVVDLEPTPAGGTTINWHSSFFPRFPGLGRILQRGLGQFLAECANGLAAYAAASNDATREVG